MTSPASFAGLVRWLVVISVVPSKVFRTPGKIIVVFNVNQNEMNAAMSTPQKNNKAIDWREVERRLDAARVAIERIWAPAAEDTQRILKERAQTLAREPERAEAADAGIEVIEFLLADERYAVESEYVREVYPLEDLTPLS